MQNATCALIAAISRESQRATLRRLFGEVQLLRTVTRYGFVSVPRYYLDVDPGLSRQRVSIWVYEGNLRIESQETLLAWYRCAQVLHSC